MYRVKVLVVLQTWPTYQGTADKRPRVSEVWQANYTVLFLIMYRSQLLPLLQYISVYGTDKLQTLIKFYGTEQQVNVSW